MLIRSLGLTLEAGGASIETDTRSRYQDFDAGYVVGVGTRLQRQLQVRFRYSSSFGSIRRIGPTQYNQVLQLQATYFFRLLR